MTWNDVKTVVGFVAVFLAIAFFVAASSLGGAKQTEQCIRIPGETVSIFEIPISESGKEIVDVLQVHFLKSLVNPQYDPETGEEKRVVWTDQNVFAPVEGHRYDELGEIISCQKGVIAVNVRFGQSWQVWEVCYAEECKGTGTRRIS